MKEFLGELAETYIKGGAIMHFISAVAIASLAIMAERVYVLWMKSSINTRSFIDAMRKLISENNIEGAINFCKQKADPLAKITQAGLTQFREGDPDFKDAMNIAAMTNLPHLERRTPYLGMLGNLATLLGLLGTIHGLIISFEAVGGADASQKSILLAKGIAVAMVATFYGLSVAIPNVVLYSVIQSRTQRVVEGIEEGAATVAALLDHRAERA